MRSPAPDDREVMGLAVAGNPADDLPLEAHEDRPVGRDPERGVGLVKPDPLAERHGLHVANRLRLGEPDRNRLFKQAVRRAERKRHRREHRRN